MATYDFNSNLQKIRKCVILKQLTKNFECDLQWNWKCLNWGRDLQSRPGHFHRFPLFTIADSGKQW